MSTPSGSGSGSQPPAGPSKAIGNLAKKPTDTTRMGATKLKFTPTLPVRRKKEEVKAEVAPTSTPAPSGRGRGRGRGRGAGSETRGGAPSNRPPAVEMVASGPFALGPAQAGSAAHRRVPRSNFGTAIAPGGPGAGTGLGRGLSATAAPTLERGKGKEKETQVKKEEDEAEVYSDPDEGVEIVDMEDVKRMDWMAPESLRRERERKKRKKKVEVVKKEEGEALVDEMDVEAAAAAGEVDLTNALDLSESEEEEELEDLIEDFALRAEIGEEPDVRQERLYFFQFPEPFLTFTSPSSTASAPAAPPDPPDDKGKKAVSFTQDTKPPAAGTAPPPVAAAESSTTTASGTPEASRLDGLVGHLEIYQSGAVKMRFGNGVVMDVAAATQPAFLQHAVQLDMTKKRMNVIGEVNKRFVVSPDVDALLEDAERGDAEAGGFDLGDGGLLRMDES